MDDAIKQTLLLIERAREVGCNAIRKLKTRTPLLPSGALKSNHEEPIEDFPKENTIENSVSSKAENEPALSVATDADLRADDTSINTLSATTILEEHDLQVLSSMSVAYCHLMQSMESEIKKWQEKQTQEESQCDRSEMYLTSIAQTSDSSSEIFSASNMSNPQLSPPFSDPNLTNNSASEVAAPRELRDSLNTTADRSTACEIQRDEKTLGSLESVCSTANRENLQCFNALLHFLRTQDCLREYNRMGMHSLPWKIASKAAKSPDDALWNVLVLRRDIDESSDRKESPLPVMWLTLETHSDFLRKSESSPLKAREHQHLVTPQKEFYLWVAFPENNAFLHTLVQGVNETCSRGEAMSPSEMCQIFIEENTCTSWAYLPFLQHVARYVCRNFEMVTPELSGVGNISTPELSSEILKDNAMHALENFESLLLHKFPM